MTDNKEISVPPGYCRCGACEKVMPVSEWEQHIKEPKHLRLVFEFYKMIDDKLGRGC